MDLILILLTAVAGIYLLFCLARGLIALKTGVLLLGDQERQGPWVRWVGLSWILVLPFAIILGLFLPLQALGLSRPNYLVIVVIALATYFFEKRISKQ